MSQLVKGVKVLQTQKLTSTVLQGEQLPSVQSFLPVEGVEAVEEITLEDPEALEDPVAAVAENMVVVMEDPAEEVILAVAVAEATVLQVVLEEHLEGMGDPGPRQRQARREVDLQERM